MKQSKGSSTKSDDAVKNYIRLNRNKSKLLLHAHTTDDINLYKFFNYKPHKEIAI